MKVEIPRPVLKGMKALLVSIVNEERITDPRKTWKLSPMDLEAHRRCAQRFSKRMQSNSPASFATEAIGKGDCARDSACYCGMSGKMTSCARAA